MARFFHIGRQRFADINILTPHTVKKKENGCGTNLVNCRLNSNYLWWVISWGLRLIVASWILRINLASSILLSSSDESETLLFSDTGGDEDKSNDLFESSPLEEEKSNDGKIKKFGKSANKLNEALTSLSLGADHSSLGMWWSLLLETSSVVSDGSLNKESGRKSNLNKY